MNTSIDSARSGATLYRTIWRWHFYAGVFCLPFVLMLSASGMIYLFKPQIDSYIDRPFQQLPYDPNTPRRDAQSQITAAQNAIPDSAFLNYRLAENPNDAVVISLRAQDEKWLVYVDPYNLDILKKIKSNSQLIRQVRSFHGELLAGNVGSIIVELAGCWAILLLTSGIYLWWPRNGNGMAGALYPRLNSGKRIFWRDLHAVTGIWISAITLFFLISALPWTLVWGTAFKELRAWQVDEVKQDWSTGRATEHHAMQHSAVPQLHLDAAVMTRAQQLQFAAPVELAPTPDGNWKLESQSQNRPLRAEAIIESGTGRVLQHSTFSERPLLDRIIGIAVAAHEGQLFGWANQLLGLLTALGLILICVSGATMWWQRKPANKLGAPVALSSRQVPPAIIGLILILMLFLPLVALSIIIIALMEFLMLKRLAKVRDWLGLPA